jgi:hypothetical protein
MIPSQHLYNGDANVTQSMRSLARIKCTDMYTGAEINK